MKTEYLSIKDFAERAGVSQQSLYKRLNKLNNQLNNYIKLVDNQKMIDIRALQEVYGVEVEQPIQPIIQPVEQPIQPLLQATIESLSKELERKSEELQAKDKQYSDLVASMNEQLKAKDTHIANLDMQNVNLVKQMEEKDKLHHEEQMNLQQLLEHEQQLNARNQEIIKELESKQALIEQKEPVEAIEPDEPPTLQKGFWAKIFKK